MHRWKISKVYQFIVDLEKILPSDAKIKNLSATEGVVSFEVYGTTKEEIADVIIKIKGLDYVSATGLASAQDELAPYFLEPPLLNVPDTDGQNAEEAGVVREVIFPLLVQLENKTGTVVSDEVAAALAGTTTVDLSGATGEGAPADAAPETVEEVLP